MTLPSIAKRIADELNVQEQQVSAAVGLLDEGATVPFISRYRKEVTGGLDDSQMRTLEERLRYLSAVPRFSNPSPNKTNSRPNSNTKYKSPTPRIVSKICTCPTNPNAAPKARLQKKPDWNPWLKVCWLIQHLHLKLKPQNISTLNTISMM